MGDLSVEESPTTESYTNFFEERCPVCMLWGMTYDEFWHGDPQLVKVYRKKHDLENKKRNEEMWLQGFYYYSALQATMSQIFSKNKSDARGYLEEPVPITKQDMLRKQIADEEAKMRTMLARMQQIQIGVNKRMEEDTDE